MKRFSLLLPFFFLLLCSNTLHNERKEDVSTLKNPQGWIIDSIASGYIWYNYTGYYGTFDCNQTVNVLEIDLEGSYSMEFVYSETADSLSAFAQQYDAIAGINATYFEPNVSFVKTNGEIHCEVTLEEDHIRFWKHEGAVFYDKKKDVLKIEKGTNDSYKNSLYANIMSGAPILIDNYVPVGLNFTGNVDDSCFVSFDYEDYRRHQGVRHPRTAIAVTADGKLLLITVDGRWQASSGMSARELTVFLQTHFNPKSALNLDGGGSTTMWIKDRGVVGSHVVNFPTDNKRYDHYGQRQENSVILIKRK